MSKAFIGKMEASAKSLLEQGSKRTADLQQQIGGPCFCEQLLCSSAKHLKSCFSPPIHNGFHHACNAYWPKEIYKSQRWKSERDLLYHLKVQGERMV